MPGSRDPVEEDTYPVAVDTDSKVINTYQINYGPGLPLAAGIR